MKIYTKTGDTGQTSLASGQRVSKSDARIEVYGTVDELNSFVGLLACYVPADSEWCGQIEWIQNKLFNLGAALAEAEGCWMDESDITQMEQWIDVLQADVPPMRGFVLPGGNLPSSMAHVCRTITRRLERQMIRLDEEKSGPLLDDKYVRFVNRLSDYWFVLAQKCVKNAGIACRLWKK